MNLTEEQLNAISDMASLFYSPKEIAINIEVNEDDFDMEIKSEKGPVYKAFMKGWFESDMKLRRSTLQSAINGSTPSIQIIENYKNRI
jgi:DNA helicase IV